MSTQVKSRFLDLQALAALEHMRFSTKHRVEGTYSGRHQSRQKGGAGEFSDFREYSDGEDLRRVDWKVLARTGKAYIRLFQDEKNLLCTLAIDASNSMQFGGKSKKDLTGSKIEYVQHLATALSQVICQGQDQVGLAILEENLKENIPLGSTNLHLTHLQESIEGIKTVPCTRMAESLNKLFEQSKNRGVLMLMSDFLVDDLEELFSAVRLFRHRQSEVVIMHIIHPDEETLPEGMSFRFEGLENEGVIDCTPAEIQNEYQKRFSDHADSIRTLSLSNGCDYRRVSTAISYLDVLRDFLVQRSG